MMTHFSRLSAACAALLLGACSLVQYRPLPALSQIDHRQGYRLEGSIAQGNRDQVLLVLTFSGGGTRAAALGYGVLEELAKQPSLTPAAGRNLLDDVDIVFGVSGGSVLAAYFSLHGKDTIPAFERRFLKQNFQRQVLKQAFSAANLPRLTSPEFGRGDLLQEEFDNTLFHDATYRDLIERRKGPFAVISATDMAQGSRLDFIQENFDIMCLNLADLPIARAVAASSAVPLVFAPLTLNNHGGSCRYTLPDRLQNVLSEAEHTDRLDNQSRREFINNLQQYADSSKRPYIHLLDGGLTDNLGLRAFLDFAQVHNSSTIAREMSKENIRKIIIINVNAQNKPFSPCGVVTTMTLEITRIFLAESYYSSVF